MTGSPPRSLTIHIDPAEFEDWPPSFRALLRDNLAERIGAALGVSPAAPVAAPCLRDLLAAQPLAAQLGALADLEAERGKVMAAMMLKRDDAYCAAFKLYGGSARSAARRLAGDLARYHGVGGGWPHDSTLAGLPEATPASRRALHEILKHGAGGPPLRWRQILNIAEA